MSTNEYELMMMLIKWMRDDNEAVARNITLLEQLIEKTFRKEEVNEASD